MERWRRLVADYRSGVARGLAHDDAADARDDGAAHRTADLDGERDGWLAATLPAADLALGSVAALCSAAARAGATGPLVERGPSPARVAASFGSDRLLRLDGRPVAGFAPLSGFFRTGDGWVRTHANYPHHRARLLRLLDLPDDTDRDGFAARLADASAGALEDDAAVVGAVVARVRAEAEWRGSAPGRAAHEGPLVRAGVRDDVVGRPAAPAGGPVPLAGVRVLDLTRVIAGPVATRALAALGADVLRVDPPVPAEIRHQHLDVGQGKRSTLLDLHDPGDRERAQALLTGADVLVTGYRPGALDVFGLRPPPGAVVAHVSAWGDDGPWARRRGFDSIVQAASGIALVESPDGDAPGALPAQALDHATGYLLAAGVLDALAARGADGRGRTVSSALARTAAWLLDADGRDAAHPEAAVPGPDAVVSHGHRPRVTTARPALPGHDDHPAPAHPWGGDHGAWATSPPPSSP
ncbi:CoA transferase [Krasilnikoviella flava]|uniref:CoA-transferase family III n=1 Tax=Krasilnikoviella flava TaxID=526729 RepID=A0A1T5JYF1_9MICO|nr:CoA transferase [Krasilnikoviella flava]SKC56477.1 CoA-transferase family III [Krasilnikoviella flava]